MTRYTPHIIFENSPLSFLIDGHGYSLRKEYEARGMDWSVEQLDFSIITFYVIDNKGRLVGQIQSSDAFGVDLQLESYSDQS